MSQRLPGERILNRELSGPAGEEVVQMDVLPVAEGQRIALNFEEVNAEWRQGVVLGTEGMLTASGASSRMLVLWSDTTPTTVDVQVVQTDGRLRVYNVWDSGRGLGPFESLMATSGMLKDEPSAGTLRYRCNDIGSTPDFAKVVFTVRVDACPVQ